MKERKRKNIIGWCLAVLICINTMLPLSASALEVQDQNTPTDALSNGQLIQEVFADEDTVGENISDNKETELTGTENDSDEKIETDSEESFVNDENSGNEPELKAAVDSGITIYNDNVHNGWYYYIKNGVKKTVFCYEHDKTQPAVDGTDGYTKINFFSDEINPPTAPVTKEMIATALWVGFPSNVLGLEEKWNQPDYEADFATQQAIWGLVRGNRDDQVPNSNYLNDLHYYAANPDSPVFSKYGYTGKVQLSSDFVFRKVDDVYRTGDIYIDGTYDGPIELEKLNGTVKVFDGDTKQEITNALETGTKVYFEYIGDVPENNELQLEYTYVTSTVYLLKAADPVNQDLVELENIEHKENVKFTFAETTTAVNVRKEWIGPAQNSVTVKLMNGQTEVASHVLNEGNKWQHTFEGLDKYDAKGQEIQYSIAEVTMDGYDSQITGDMEKGFVVTNVNTEKISIPVTKQWVGKPGKSIEVTLKADDKVKETVTLTEQEQWKHTFKDLAKYDSNDGHEIKYTVSESPMAGYTTTMTGDSEKGFTITNTIVGKVSVGVTKAWIGPAQNSVTVKLMNGQTEVASHVLNEGNKWQYTFEGLDKYDAKGQEIQYSIAEVTMDGYDSQITGDMEKGFVVTNVNTEKISIPVTKQWVGKPGKSIEVTLKADDKVKETVTLTEQEQWEHTFKDLAKYDSNDGHEIKYTVSESPMAGYTTTMTGDSEKGFTITNTIVGKVSVGVTKAWIGPAQNSVTVKLMNGQTEVASHVLNEGNKWQHTFEGLDKYDAKGQEIQYSIAEVPVAGYTTAITGDMSNGFTVTNTVVQSSNQNNTTTEGKPDVKQEPKTDVKVNEAPRTGDQGLMVMVESILVFLAALTCFQILSIKKRKKTK